MLGIVLCFCPLKGFYWHKEAGGDCASVRLFPGESSDFLCVTMMINLVRTNYCVVAKFNTLILPSAD